MRTDANTTVQALREAVAAFVAERAWEPYHRPKNLAMALAAEAGELLELYQWLTPAEAEAAARPGELRQRTAEELADVLAYVLAFANALNLDLAAALEAKLAQNRARYPVPEYRGRYRKSGSPPSA